MYSTLVIVMQSFFLMRSSIVNQIFSNTYLVKDGNRVGNDHMGILRDILTEYSEIS